MVLRRFPASGRSLGHEVQRFEPMGGCATRRSARSRHATFYRGERCGLDLRAETSARACAFVRPASAHRFGKRREGCLAVAGGVAACAARSPDGRYAVKVFTRETTERIARFACELSLRRKAQGHPGKLTVATKHNVPKVFADYRGKAGLQTIGYAIAEPFHRVAVLVYRCPRCGVLDVYAGATRLGRLDLNVPSAMTGLHLWVSSRTNGKTLTFRVASSGPAVVIDGFGFSQ